MRESHSFELKSTNTLNMFVIFLHHFQWSIRKKSNQNECWSNENDFGKKPTAKINAIKCEQNESSYGDEQKKIGELYINAIVNDISWLDNVHKQRYLQQFIDIDRVNPNKNEMIRMREKKSYSIFCANG